MCCAMAATLLLQSRCSASSASTLLANTHLEGELLPIMFPLLPHLALTVALQAEGLQLMVMIVRAKTAARTGALKTVGFAVTRYPAGCEKWVDVQGLKATFGIFMGKSKVRKQQRYMAG